MGSCTICICGPPFFLYGSNSSAISPWLMNIQLTNVFPLEVKDLLYKYQKILTSIWSQTRPTVVVILSTLSPGLPLNKYPASVIPYIGCKHTRVIYKLWSGNALLVQAQLHSLISLEVSAWIPTMSCEKILQNLWPTKMKKIAVICHCPCYNFSTFIDTILKKMNSIIFLTITHRK
jgi:hypothetical protein